MHISEIQRQYFKNGETKSISFRIQQLQILQQAILKNESRIYEALKADLGKCQMEGYLTEVGFTLNDIDFMIKNIRKFAKHKKVKTPAIFLGGSSFIIPEPYGTVLIIGPWNYPFQLVMVPLIGAIAAGNCAVVKPSELTPNVSRVIAAIINDTFKSEYIAAIEGGVEESQKLLTQKFDYIFYTGSTTVGRIVMTEAAKNLTPVTLELGGKSPCIIDKDTNIKNAAKRVVWGKFLNCGQTCVAPDYVLVHKNIKEEFITNAIAAINEFYGSDPLEAEQYPHIVNERHFDRLLSLMNDGNILYGGKNNREKLYIQPTLIDSVSQDSSIMQEEIFGPIMPILEFDNLDTVISFINERPKPLALYYFSSNKSNIAKVLNETSSGGTCINDTINHITTSSLPFGGVGDSGMGSYHGKETFETFSHRKSVLHNQITYDFKLKYPPYKVTINLMKKVFRFLLN